MRRGHVTGQTDPWPFPKDPLPERLRWVARSYRAQLGSINPELCAQTDQLMTRLGQEWVTRDPSDVDPGEWVSARTAAHMLSVTMAHIAWLRREGKLSGRRIGRSWEYRARDVLGVTARPRPRHTWST